MTDYIVPTTASGYALVTIGNLHTVMGLVCYILFLILLLVYLVKSYRKCGRRKRRVRQLNIRREAANGRRSSDKPIDSLRP